MRVSKKVGQFCPKPKQIILNFSCNLATHGSSSSISAPRQWEFQRGLLSFMKGCYIILLAMETFEYQL